jgi:RNA polymerase sigma-B factor
MRTTATDPRRGSDERVRERMIERYLPLARSLARRYRRTPVPMDDLVQVASMGLVKAVDRWDPGRGVAFVSYAEPTILGELRRYFRDSSWDVRPPRRIQELCLALEPTREQLAATTGREPTVAELAERLDRPPGEVLEAMSAGQGRMVPSLDEGGEAASAAERVGAPDRGYDRVESDDAFERITSILDRRAREIVRLRFEEDLRQSEIAVRVGLSQMHVSRLLRSSLETLYAACAAPAR